MLTNAPETASISLTALYLILITHPGLFAQQTSRTGEVRFTADDQDEKRFGRLD